MESRTKHLTASVLLKDDAADPGDPGAVVARFSAFDAPDREGDIVRREAFTDGQAAPMVWAHDWSRPIGKGVVSVKQDHAEFAGSFFGTASAQEARQAVREMGELQQWSFGFKITDTKDNDKIRGLDISGLELFEVSPVLIGANQHTATLAVKSYCPTCGRSAADDDNAAEHESPQAAEVDPNDLERERLALEALALL